MLNRLNVNYLDATSLSSIAYAAKAEAMAGNAKAPDNSEKAAKRVSGMVDEAIKSSHEHGPKLKKAAIASFLMGVLNGGWTEFNRLVREVTEQDAEGIRFFVVNVTNVHGVAFMNEKEGKPSPKMIPVKYSRKEGYSTRSAGGIEGIDAGEQKIAFAKIRADLEKIGEDRMYSAKRADGKLVYAFGPNRTSDDNGGTESYDWQDDLKKALERIASKGAPKARLEAAAKGAGLDANHKPNIEGKWKDKSVKADDVEKLRKQLEAAEKAFAAQQTEKSEA